MCTLSLSEYVENLEKRKNPHKFMGRRPLEPRISVTKTQIELAFYIRNYRRIHELSQPEMAKICTLYGKSHNVKFAASEICAYENYKHMPTPPKFQILMNTMDLDPSDF